jgi:hypothetical protein
MQSAVAILRRLSAAQRILSSQARGSDIVRGMRYFTHRSAGVGARVATAPLHAQPPQRLAPCWWPAAHIGAAPHHQLSSFGLVRRSNVSVANSATADEAFAAASAADAEPAAAVAADTPPADEAAPAAAAAAAGEPAAPADAPVDGSEAPASPFPKVDATKPAGKRKQATPPADVGAAKNLQDAWAAFLEHLHVRGHFSESVAPR